MECSFDGVEFKNKIEKFRQHAGVAKLRIEAKFRVESTDRFLQNTSVDFWDFFVTNIPWYGETPWSLPKPNEFFHMC